MNTKAFTCKLVLVIAFCLAINSKGKASHFVSGSVSYTFTGTPNTYLLTFKFYRDCSGISAPSQINLCYSSALLAYNSTVTLLPIAGTGQEVTLGPCFASSVTTCSGGTAYGIQEYIFEGTVTLPQASTDWLFAYEECCRPIANTNIVGNPGMYVYVTLDNLNAPTNNSPVFVYPAYSQHCIGIPTIKSFNCIDVDGDSLVYQMDSVLDANFGCPYLPINLQFIAPYTAMNPFSSSTPFVLNSTNGELSFTPNLVQSSSAAVLVSEYRNGVLISQTHADNMINSINGLLYTNQMTGKVYNDLNTNGVFNPGEPGLPFKIVEINPGPYYYSTNSFGDYIANLAIGNYTAYVNSIYSLYSYTPAIQQANFTAGYQIDSQNDFGYAPIGPNIQDLRITVTGGNVRPGLPAYITITAANLGSSTVSNAIVNFNLDTLLTFVNSLPVAASSTLHTASWTITNFQPFQTQNYTINVDVAASAILGSYLNSSAEIQPIATDTFPIDNIDNLSQQVVNAFDPNNKTVEPSGPITLSQVSNGIYLEYTINFQNTGTAPAINVNIKDTLDLNFIIPSFEVLSASHNYTWAISPSGMITFTFANINLPDSGANETASHGFIKYRIMPKHNLVFGNKVNNTAYIYFDFNAPVVTNYTSTTVLNSTGIIKTEKGKDILVYPNPTSGTINIDFNDKLFSDVNLELFSIAGQRVFYKEQKRASDQLSLELKNLDKGIYFMQLARNGKVYRTKIVLE